MWCAEWRDKHPDQAVPDGLVLTQPWPSTSAEKARGIPDRMIHYQYRHDRARRTLRGIDEQVRKAERAVDGHAPVKRNRYIQPSSAATSSIIVQACSSPQRSWPRRSCARRGASGA
jgi:hypothetical protein